MSQPSIVECQAEAYDMIRREWLIEHGNYPTEEEFEEEYVYLWEKFGIK